jgi:outer membrane protein assembly factor BamB
MSDRPPSRRGFLAVAGGAGVAAILGGVGSTVLGGTGHGSGPSDVDGAAEKDGTSGQGAGDERVRWAGVGNGPARDGRVGAAGPTDEVRVGWTRTVDHLTVTTAAVYGDTVVVGSYDGVMAIDLATGDRVWTVDREQVRGVAATADAILAAAEDRVLALDPVDGTRLWTTTLGEDGVRPPTVAGERAYVAVGDGAAIVAVELGSGEVVWRRRLAGDWLPASVAVADGTVYAGTETGAVTALDAPTGEERWSTPLVQVPEEARRAHSFGLGAAPAVDIAGGRVVVGDETGVLHAVDAESGDRVWSFAPPTRERARARARERDESFDGFAWGGAAVADGTVYAGCEDGRLYAVDAATGEPSWRFWAWGAVESRPAVTDAAVYVGADDAMVYALDRTTGDRHWEAATDGRVRAGPAVVDGTVLALGRAEVLAVTGEPPTGGGAGS